MPIIRRISAGKVIRHEGSGGDRTGGGTMKRKDGTNGGEMGKSLPLERVVKLYRIPKRTIRTMVREGLLEIEPTPAPSLRPEMVERVRLIVALRRDLGVNMAGVEVILRLRHQLVWARTQRRTAFCESWIDVPE